MRPCARQAWGLQRLRAPPPAPREVRGPPPDVPLDWLSTRSLMDHCMGRGAWRHRRASAQTLRDLPLLTSPAHVARVRSSLETRAIHESCFVAWYNVMTRATWQESAHLLDAMDVVPPFVLQRALSRVRGIPDAASAIRIAQKHCPTYSIDNATRIVAMLLDTCFASRAWHVAGPLTELAVVTALAWLSRKNAQPEHAQALLQQCAGGLLGADDDPRARRALLHVVRVAQTHVPRAAAWMAQSVVRLGTSRGGRRRRRRPDSVLHPDVIEALLDACPPEHVLGLLALGVRVAAMHRDTQRAQSYFAQIAPEARPTHAFLQALAHSPSQSDLHAAWALFDAMCTQRAPAHAPPRLADWMLMLRAAAGDARIPAQQVLALLQIHDGSTTQAQRAATQWHAPPAIAARLATSRIAYASVLDGFLARGDLVRARGVWDVQVRRGLAPDAAALTSLCKVHLRSGHAAHALAAIAQWCHDGVMLPSPAPGWLRLSTAAAPPGRWDADAAHSEPAVHAPVRARKCHRIQATTHLVNTLLVGLLRLDSLATLFSVWRAMGPALRVCPDVATLDVVLHAAARTARAPTPDWVHAYGVCEYVRRTLHTQHPELASCKSALDMPGSRSWLLRGERHLRRWERWLEQRVSALFPGTVPAVRVPMPTAPIALDARVLHQYAVLLYALMDRGGENSVGWVEELFRVPAYLQALDLAPERATICLLYCVQDTVLPPGVASRRSDTPLSAMLRAWLGEAALPSDEEIGAYFRAQRPS